MSHPLSEPFARWMTDVLPGTIPPEVRATCHECAMLTRPDGTAPAASCSFRPEVKCCVYTPRLANFLVGGILAEEDEDLVPARDSIRERIAQRVAVTPLGLLRPPRIDLLLRNSKEAFGNSEALRCPHYLLDGRCGIWKHRESTCATWFCHYVRGREGYEFWLALRRLLAAVERSVAAWCAHRLGVEPDLLQPHLPPVPSEVPLEAERRPWYEMDGTMDPAAYSAMWGWLEGGEEQFYRDCADLAAGLSWADVALLGGVELEVRVAIIRSAWERLVGPSCPVRAVAGTWKVDNLWDGGVRVTTFSDLDALELPAPLVALLPRFDGRPLGEVLDELQEADAAPDPDLLQRLVDWQILVPTEVL